MPSATRHADLLPNPYRSSPVKHDDDLPSIDLVHLSRQTLGDRDLEVELLNLFAEQARRIVQTLTSSSAQGVMMPKQSGDLLHKLCGSARAVGSWRVADQAQSLEREIRSADPHHSVKLSRDKLEQLGGSVDLACSVIDDLLGRPE
ncbi:Hpt domain-containing protein [Lichenihabitans psoromatis]|uniref:Hpt domain-containing protein n=1 Tax=Lichenihabitans psoromatis TaxID=2528642 RepID=UPI0013F15760|nr:Hpt domain-containing protein [Lichenihabitans psoromatis]